MKDSKVNTKRRGSVLVFILVLIVLISVLSMRLIEEGVREINHLSQFHRRDDLRMHAYSALDIAVGVLNEFKMVEGKLYSPAQVRARLRADFAIHAGVRIGGLLPHELAQRLLAQGGGSEDAVASARLLREAAQPWSTTTPVVVAPRAPCTATSNMCMSACICMCSCMCMWWPNIGEHCGRTLQYRVRSSDSDCGESLVFGECGCNYRG